MKLSKVDEKLLTAIEFAKPLEEIQKALVGGANPNCISDGRGYPLSIAAGLKRVYALEPLVQAGAAINGPAEALDPTLFLAYTDEHLPVVRELLRLGADPEVRGLQGHSAFCNAAVSNSRKLVTLYLDSGCDPNSRTVRRSTALHLAAQHAGEKMIRLLLDRGATVDLVNVRGKMPVDFADDPKIRKLLRETMDSGKNKATPDQRASEARGRELDKQLFVAIDQGDLGKVKGLIQEGACIHAIDEREASTGDTVLHRAVLYGDPKPILFFLEERVDAHEKNRQDLTPQDLVPNPEFEAWMSQWFAWKKKLPSAVTPRLQASPGAVKVKKEPEDRVERFPEALWNEMIQPLKRDCQLADFEPFELDRWPLISKVGGIPYSEKGEKWPICQSCDRPLSFVFQVNLEDHPTPGPGILSLFLCFSCGAEGMVDAYEEGESSALRFHSSPSREHYQALKRPRHPDDEEIADNDPIRNCKLSFRRKPCYPPLDHTELKLALAKAAGKAGITSDQAEQIYDNELEFQMDFDALQSTRLGGYPGWIQGDETPVCHCGKEMSFVLQLGSEEKAGMSWVDTGSIYFFRCPDPCDRWESVLQFF